MKSPPTGRLDSTVLERFLSLCRKRAVPSKHMIITAAEIPDRLYYLVEGSVEVIIEDDDGHEMVLAYLNSGHFFGEMGFFDRQQKTRSAWVRARRECIIAEMNYDEFTVLAATEQALVVELATQMAIRLFGADSKLSDLAFLDVKGRVAHVLLELCHEPDAESCDEGWRVRVRPSQLARLVGCSREMVFRVLKMMQSEGLIFNHDDGIVVRGESMVLETAPA